MRNIITTTIAVTKEHYARIYKPARATPDIGDLDQAPRYCMYVPYQHFPQCRAHTRVGIGPSVRISSIAQPLVIPGDDLPSHQSAWASTLVRAEEWKYPLDKLLIGREIAVATDVRHVRNKYCDQNVAFLVAVQIKGDFESLGKDEGLEAHIREVKSWFDLYDR